MALPKNPGRTALAVAASLSMLISLVAFAQQTSPGSGSGSSAANSQSQTDQSSKPAKPTGGNSGSNAFPMAQSEAAAKAAAQQNQREQTPSSDSSAQPNASSTGSSNGNASPSRKKPSPSTTNPFPQAQSEAAAKADNGGSGQPPNTQSQPANTQKGSPPAGYSSSNANLPPADLGQGGSISHPKLDSFTRDQTQDGRVEGDLGVADFYMKNGNYRGALLRYRDALRYDPQNDKALFGVAEATCKQNRTGDAMALFKSYATSNPQGKYALKAEKMLAHPRKCMHNF